MSIPETIISISNLFPITKIDGLLVLDFWNSYRITDEYKKLSQDVDTYLIKDKERWDLLAQKLYGDRELWWLIVLINDIEDPFSLYFDMDISSSIRKIKVLKESNVGFILNIIRDRIITLEQNRLIEEEKNRKQETK